MVCLAEGEGERSGEESGDRGYSGVKASLTKSLYDVKNVFLLREKKVPADCTVLVVAGPEKDLLPETTAAVRDYVKSGGKALVMVEPELKEHYPNLVALLKEWNIEAGNDVVVDVSGMGQLFGFSELAPLAIEYPYHAITNDFRLPTLYGGARSIQAGKATIDGVSAQDLVKTSEQSWAESDLSLKGPIKFEEGKDHKGPVALAAVGTVRGTGAPAPAPTPRRPPRPPLARRRRRRRSRRRRPRAASSRSATPTSPRTRSSPSRATRTLPQHDRVARRGHRPHLDPAEGAREPGDVPEPPGPAERGVARPRDPARPVRDRRGRVLVAEAVAR